MNDEKSITADIFRCSELKGVGEEYERNEGGR
jgi:hypothetical protein